MATAVKRLLVGRALRTEQAISRTSHEENCPRRFLFRRAFLNSLRHGRNPARAGSRCCRNVGHVVSICDPDLDRNRSVAGNRRDQLSPNDSCLSVGWRSIHRRERKSRHHARIDRRRFTAGRLRVDGSVSIAAGVAAITSAVQGTRYAWLDDHKVILCLVFIAFIAIANLRGVRESGALFATPTYVFVVSFLFMIAFRLVSLLHLRRRRDDSCAGRTENR